MVDSSINAGVSAQTGFALQRNTALYLLLENYVDKFKDRNYFICLEHHEDFLFCFTNESNEAEVVEAYQSKKKSPSSWTLDDTLYQIIKKLLKTGKELWNDNHPKSSTYKHILYFSTNQTTNLVVKEKNKVVDSVSIKEDNQIASFELLPQKIQNKISEGIADENLNDELDRFKFIWVDLNRTIEKQENELVGQIDKVFGNSIYNKRAAVKALIELFREIEEKYNQGNKARLLDTSKRVNSNQIEVAFKILTSRSKCFDFWHKQSREISIALKIKPTERNEFEFAFESSFDFFKSLQEAEHRKILDFVSTNVTKCQTYTDEDNVAELIQMFNDLETSPLGDIELKAVFFAAYFEVTFKGQN